LQNISPRRRFFERQRRYATVVLSVATAYLTIIFIAWF
jgi:hypothetical protein